MKTFDDVKSDYRYHAISLAKLLDLKVVDVVCYLKKENKHDDIQLCAVELVLENGMKLELESSWTSYDTVIFEDDSNEYFRNKEAGVDHHSRTILGLWDNHHNELRNIFDTMPGWGYDVKRGSSENA